MRPADVAQPVSIDQWYRPALNFCMGFALLCNAL